MSFKPRRQPLVQRQVILNNESESHQSKFPSGVRPSPLDGRLTTSTGTISLDSLLAGHMGLALGTMLLIGESGTTDFSGCLLKYYAAEGAVQDHQVHVLGAGEIWGKELPAVSNETRHSQKSSQPVLRDKMKIAWRYERLGDFSSDAREISAVPNIESSASIFCHDFDLSRRLTMPFLSNIKYVPIQAIDVKKQPIKSVSPFSSFLTHLQSELDASSLSTIHRVVIHNLLSPVIYNSEFINAKYILQFLHALRALLRTYSTQLTAMITFPLMLYPRSTGLTRWMEILSDGVMELAPLPPLSVPTKHKVAASIPEEAPQGIVRVHKLPIFHEKGGGGGLSEFSRYGDNLAFTLSRRKGLVIKPYYLPPVDGEEETKHDASGDSNNKISEADIQF